MAKSSTSNIVDTVGEWYDKLPHLPKGGRELIVAIAPWVALIFGILYVFWGIAGLGILSVLGPFMMYGGSAPFGSAFLGAAFLLVGGALMLMAFSGLKNHKEKGWTFLYWSEVVWLVSVVLSVSLGGVIGSLIAFYLLYEVRSYYK